MTKSTKHHSLDHREDQEKDFKGITDVGMERYLEHEYYKKVLPYLRTKKVLDVGCLDDGETGANEIRLWNHWFVVNVSRETVGIDIREKPLVQLRQMGLKVKRMDAQKISFREKFDVVFAGELVEHLPNPGLFLVSAANVLAKSGMIILSTPNPFSLSRLMRVVQFLTNEPNVNPDHTLYFSPQNMRTMAAKCKLRVTKIDYAHFPFTHQGLLVKLNQIGCKILGDKFKEQMLVFMKKTND